VVLRILSGLGGTVTRADEAARLGLTLWLTLGLTLGLTREPLRAACVEPGARLCADALFGA
jgi:hypothetical protein